MHTVFTRALLLVGFCAGIPSLCPGQEWRELTTRHYTIKTDLQPQLAQELARRMDSMFDEYARRLIEFSPSAEHSDLQVYLYSSKADYLELTGNRFPNTGGVFMPGRNLLAAYLEGQGRDALRRTLQHEAFHQFAHAAISSELPIWLNEGMAQHFEEGIWTGQSFLVGQVPPRRVRQIKTDMELKRLMRFEQFMALTHDQWAKNLARDPEAGATQYNQAWAMVHFLVHGDNGRESYRPRLIKMLRLLHGGTPADAAFREAFSGNLDGFEERFVAWAQQLEPTPEATMIERQDILADLLVALDERGRRFHAIEDFREALAKGGYRLQYTRNHIQWQTDPDPKVYFTGIDGAEFTRDQLYFSPRSGAPLPDVVSKCSDSFQLRTRFHQVAATVEHEVLVEPRGRAY
jgi:hypothetical protein